MSKVVFTADVHFGVNGRLADILFACNTIKEYCRHAGIDTVVVLGDLFHDRQAINIEVLTTVCNFFEEVEALGQRWITFPGNHDMFLRHSWGINSLQALKRHLTVIEDISILKLDEQRFWVLPFVTFEKSYMRILRRMEKKFEPGDKLLTHIGVRGATLNTCFLLKDWSIVNFDYLPFEKVYTGHFHSKQKVGDKVWYPGSPIPFKFDEGDVPHGFFVYDTVTDSHGFVNIWDAAKKFFPDIVPPPQFRTILDEDVNGLTVADVQHNIVRIALQRTYTQDEKGLLRNKLQDMGAKAVRWMDLAQKIEQRVVIEKSKVENRDLFKAFTSQDANGLKDLDDRLLTQLHDEIVHDGDELYAVEESEIQ